jgi:hypothetical protein
VGYSAICFIVYYFLYYLTALCSVLPVLYVYEHNYVRMHACMRVYMYYICMYVCIMYVCIMYVCIMFDVLLCFVY